MNDEQNPIVPSQEEMTEEQKKAMEAGESAAPETSEGEAEA